MTTPFWSDQLAKFYEALRRNGLLDDQAREAWANQRVSELRSRLAQYPSDLTLLQESMLDIRRGMEWASFFEHVTWMPESLFMPMLRTALRVPAEGVFVRACVACVGSRRVLESLLDVFATGSNSEKVAACDCSYWAQPGLVYEGADNFERGIATTESQNAFDLLYELQVRMTEQRLHEFLRNPDAAVRAAILRCETLDLDDYPNHLQSLVRDVRLRAQND